ncbi:MAG: hypothetical protein IJU70_06470 [Lentisphaeria bacterium]|nr:hypothetical protein [Lentisphaeria bacterium]
MAKLILPTTTTPVRTANTPVAGEIFYDRTDGTYYGGDGATPGGVPFALHRPYDGQIYGVDYDTSVATAASACRKVVLNSAVSPGGDPASYTAVQDFGARPAHNWRRCVVNTATRTVNYYLHPTDSTKKMDGTAAVLSGEDGEVMVEIPVTYYRIDKYTDSSSHEHIVWLVSAQMFPGAAPHPFFYTSPGGATLRTQYIAAFMPTLTDGETIAAGGKLRSIVGDSIPLTGISLSPAMTGYSRAGLDIANISFQWFM